MEEFRAAMECSSKICAFGSLSKLFEDSVFSDFTFIVQGEKFKVHRSILGVASPVFMKLFTADMLEKNEGICHVSEIDPLTFREMLRFIYGVNQGEYRLDKIALYKAAHYYQIDALMEYCLKFINRFFTKSNVVATYDFASRYNLEELKIKSWTRVKR